MSRAYGGRWLTTSPRMTTCPALGSSRPAMIFNTVVLPHPLGPSKVRNSPLLTRRENASTASTLPNDLLISTSSTSNIVSRSREMPPPRDPHLVCGGRQGETHLSHEPGRDGSLRVRSFAA